VSVSASGNVQRNGKHKRRREFPVRAAVTRGDFGYLNQRVEMAIDPRLELASAYLVTICDSIFTRCFASLNRTQTPSRTARIKAEVLQTSAYRRPSRTRPVPEPPVALRPAWLPRAKHQNASGACRQGTFASMASSAARSWTRPSAF
jgi:hypothetical protein